MRTAVDVFGGTQTWEEMMVPFFGVLVDALADPNRVIDLPGQVGAIPCLVNGIAAIMC